MDFINLCNLTTSFFITVCLILAHAVSPYLNRHKFFGQPFFVSFSGGTAVAYVFLHMLPSLVENNEPLGKLLSQYDPLTPLLDLGIFIAALIGFMVYYGLERLAWRVGNVQRENQRPVYYLHVFLFALYNFLITYTMPLRVQTGLSFAVIFAVAIGLHFMLVDRNFSAHFGKQFSGKARLMFLLALLLGWVVTVVTDPVNVLLVSLMVAFLAGSVLYNVFREELPMGKNSSFGGFCVGVILFAGLLLWQAMSSHNP